MDSIYTAKIANGIMIEIRGEADLGLRVDDKVVFHRDFFDDIAVITGRLEAPSRGNAEELPAITRLAVEEDFKTAESMKDKERSAMNICSEWVERLMLPMKLINAHYSLEGKSVTIQFSGDGYVDFRELVKELSRALSCRIELHQIGVRDESSIYGGIAVCGQVFCCSRFLHEFSSINVKMAKDQDLSLTPSSISGVCGRLKCCLKFEHEGYLELQKGLPRKGDSCDTPDGRGRVTDRNILTGKLSVLLDSGNVKQFSADEVSVLRGEHRSESSSHSNSAGNDRKSGDAEPEKPASGRSNGKKNNDRKRNAGNNR